MDPPSRAPTTYLIDGQEVKGRAAALITWIARNKERINRPGKGRLTFNYAGQQISGELTEKIEKVS